MVSSEARRLWFLAFGQTPRCVYALESESDHGPTSAVFVELLEGGDVCSGPVSSVWISRPTAYRWINRYNETGLERLVDRSRRPHSCSHATLEPIENAILALRAKHPSWGLLQTNQYDWVVVTRWTCERLRRSSHRVLMIRPARACSRKVCAEPGDSVSNWTPPSRTGTAVFCGNASP